VQTLYDLLGALPDDDADDLRAAFRNAVKANHPDNNPDDPDAPQRFRRIVRANAILSDERQRAEYDSLLAKARQQESSNSRRKIFSEVRYQVPNPISTMVIASVSIGAFLLIERVLTDTIVPAQVQDIAAQASDAPPAMPATTPSQTVGFAAGHTAPDKASVPSETDIPDVGKEIAAPLAGAATDAAGAVPAVSEPEVKDAGYYRQRGSVAYRSGDLSLALIDFDLAINLDPNSSDAYIDRAIVLHRMGDMKRALADIAQAKRIDDLKP
jgi:curved DNA-binding protein CbpA